MCKNVQLQRGNTQINLQNEVLCENDHFCIANAAEIEVRREVENCKNKEDISVLVNVIFKEEISKIFNEVYDFVTIL